MKNYLILIRPYGMLFLGFTPVFGAIANGEFNLIHLTILLIIGLLAHIFTFVQNDYYDTAIDSKSKYVSNRPLVTGSITQKTAFKIFLASFIISLLLAIVFFSYYSFVFLLLSFLFMTFYNKYSKKFYGMEYILCIGVFTYGIFGALTVSNNISYLAIIVTLFGFMQWLFSVGVSANLKDVEYDIKLGIKTTPTAFGVKVSNKGLIIPLSFKIYTVSIKIIHILIASLPLFLGYTSIFVYGLPIPGFCFLIISILVLYCTIKILTISMKERDKMLIYVGIQEGLALLLLPILLMSILIDKFEVIQTFLLISLFIYGHYFGSEYFMVKK